MSVHHYLKVTECIQLTSFVSYHCSPFLTWKLGFLQVNPLIHLEGFWRFDCRYFVVSNDVFHAVRHGRCVLSWKKGRLMMLGYFLSLIIWLGLAQEPLAACFDFSNSTVLLRLSSTHADTNCPRADCVSSWTMVLIGMGVSYGVGTRVFVQLPSPPSLPHSSPLSLCPSIYLVPTIWAAVT